MGKKIEEQELEELQKCLSAAELLLWAIINRGHFDSHEKAQAAYDAHKAVDKARNLVLANLSQLGMEIPTSQ